MADRFRSGRHRRRPRRLCRGHPGGPARHEGRLRRKAADEALGGTCLNVGCIPSKALLDSSEFYEQAQHKAARARRQRRPGRARPGGDAEAQGQAWSKALTDGIAYLFKKNGVTPIFGHRQARRPGQGRVKPPTARRPLEAARRFCWRPAASRRRCRTCRSTASTSSPRPKRWRSTRCRSISSSSAAATSAWNWARSGCGSGRRSRWSNSCRASCR